MPTTVESRLARVEDRVEQMWEWINGGPTTRYDESARGRLHKIVNSMATEDLLTEALREARRERRHAWSTWQKVGLFICAVLTTSCSVIAALAVLGVI